MEASPTGLQGLSRVIRVRYGWVDRDTLSAEAPGSQDAPVGDFDRRGPVADRWRVCHDTTREVDAGVGAVFHTQLSLSGLDSLDDGCVRGPGSREPSSDYP